MTRPLSGAGFSWLGQAADFNGDGRADLIGNANSTAFIALGKADGTFVAPVNIDSMGGNGGVASARDINGDGKLDVLIGFDSMVHFLAGNGDGTFAAPKYYSTSIPNPFSFAIGDYNGDGRLDVATGGSFAGPSVLLNGCAP